MPYPGVQCLISHSICDTNKFVTAAGCYRFGSDEKSIGEGILIGMKRKAVDCMYDNRDTCYFGGQST
jgi:hypothetical protein